MPTKRLLLILRVAEKPKFLIFFCFKKKVQHDSYDGNHFSKTYFRKQPIDKKRFPGQTHTVRHARRHRPPRPSSKYCFYVFVSPPIKFRFKILHCFGTLVRDPTERPIIRVLPRVPTTDFHDRLGAERTIILYARARRIQLSVTTDSTERKQHYHDYYYYYCYNARSSRYSLTLP